MVSEDLNKMYPMRVTSNVSKGWMKQRVLIIFSWLVKIESGAVAALMAVLMSVPGWVDEIDVAMVAV